MKEGGGHVGPWADGGSVKVGGVELSATGVCLITGGSCAIVASGVDGMMMV